jgi:hypothetical protein
LRTRPLALCVFFLAAAGCVDQAPTAATANALIVHAVLDLSTRDQYVVIQSTTGSIDQQRPVTGAIVTITTPDGHALLADETLDSTRYLTPSTMPRVTTVYRVSLDRYGIDLVPGGTYRLRVTTPDGREVSGVTTIPNAVLDTAPTTQTIDRRDTVRMSVPRAVGVSAYEVVASWRSRTAFFSDTAVALPAPVVSTNGPGGIVFEPPTPWMVVVSAVDQNYYDYFRRASDPWTGSGVISHLDGAIGVFGSMVSVLRLQVIVQ